LVRPSKGFQLYHISSRPMKKDHPGRERIKQAEAYNRQRP
jgi:hypothetical protein